VEPGGTHFFLSVPASSGRDYQDRLHDSLRKDTPQTRPVEHKPTTNATVISLPRLGGLQHRYAWHKAA
jgi:hypothetical protein